MNTSAEWIEHFLISERTERRFDWEKGWQRYEILSAHGN
jgi:hypothetical protein